MNKELITDKLQQNWDLSNYNIIRDIILFLTGYILYANIPSQDFTHLIKLYFAFILIRFTLSELTLRQNFENDKVKKYFQLSGHVGLFTLFIIFAAKNNLLYFSNPIFSSVILLSYAMFNSIVRAHYTTDVILTITFIYSFINLNLF